MSDDSVVPLLEMEKLVTLAPVVRSSLPIGDLEGTFPLTLTEKEFILPVKSCGLGTDVERFDEVLDNLWREKHKDINKNTMIEVVQNHITTFNSI